MRGLRIVEDERNVKEFREWDQRPATNVVTLIISSSPERTRSNFRTRCRLGMESLTRAERGLREFLDALARVSHARDGG